MAEFCGHGGVCVASCYNQKRAETRAAVDLRGHSSCVTFTPGDDEHFAVNYGRFIERHAKNAGRVFVIVGDMGEEGQWQQKEMDLLRDHSIPFEKLTLMEYDARYPASASSKTLADGTVEQGCFHEETGALQAGRRRWPHGEVEEGAFAQGGLLQQGRRRRADGTEELGTFAAVEGQAQLQRGSSRWPNGYLEEGDFFAGTGRLRRGRVSYADGDVLDGEWDRDARRLRGVYRCADGQVEEGEFDEEWELARGRRRHPDGREEWVGGPLSAEALQGLVSSGRALLAPGP